MSKLKEFCENLKLLAPIVKRNPMTVVEASVLGGMNGWLVTLMEGSAKGGIVAAAGCISITTLTPFAIMTFKKLEHRFMIFGGAFIATCALTGLAIDMTKQERPDAPRTVAAPALQPR